MFKYISILFVCCSMASAGFAQTDTALLQKKFSYVLPQGWSLQDRFMDGWADQAQPDPPILCLDYILFDVTDAAKMKAYIDLNLKAMQESDNPDAKIIYSEKRQIHGVPFSIVQISYMQDGVPWLEYQYFTPKECGSICKGYLFMIQAPASRFKSMVTEIVQFEVGLRVES